MKILSLKLTSFRNHKKKTFNFPQVTIIIGKNTSGKTSILEAITFLSHGKSFKAEKDFDCINGSCDFARIEGEVEEDNEKIKLSVVIALQNERATKKYLVNNVPRSQNNFVSNLLTVLFTPEDLEIINDSPSIRRNYLNSVLVQSDKEYRVSLNTYEKALRRRNRMLYLTRENKKFFTNDEFEYWDNLIIENGQIVTKYRQEFINYVNNAKKDIFDLKIKYDKSTISRERLDKYKDAELASAKTLVGPQRDEIIFENLEGKSIKEFGSRGEQRLTIFQTKLIETLFLIEKTGKTPVLLLDDIFSELDAENIIKVLDLLPHHQVIITTTHEEFIPKRFENKEEVEIIEL
jgi:DNA replication and repair protein RecF